MTVKVKVGQSKNIRLIAAGEKRPVIVPDSITLGIDTVGEYVASIDAGQGIVVTPENNLETANLVISHAITTTEVSSNNSTLEFIRNASIDQFGHITALFATGLDANNFISVNNVISSKQITFGNTAITLGESTSEFRNLDLVEVGDFTISANTISAPDNINFNIANSDGIINAGIHRIVNVEDPIDLQDVVNKRYLEVELDRIETTVKVVNDPVLPTDGANKRYVDGLVQGLIVRPSALAATTADLGGAFEVGNSAVASTITLDPVQFLYIDDVTTWDLYSNLLVKDQINPEENGSYDLIQVGSANTAWVFQRTVWSNESSEIPGSYEFVTKGTVNGGTGWVATVLDAANFRIDLDDVVWSQFSGEGTFTAGQGLTLNSRQFNVNVDNSSIEIFNNNLRVKDAGITNAKLENSQITFGLTTVSLGSNSNIIEGLTRLGVAQINGANNFLTVQANTVFIDGNGGIVIPIGTTLERPAEIQGTIRYNISDGQFEGYDGIAWSGLGGVIDVNQDTKITAENSPGANNDELKFFTGGTLAAKIDSANNAFFYGNVDIAGDVTIGGNIRIGDQDVDTVTIVADFTSNLIPDVDRTYNLGSELKNWNYVYFDTLRSSDEVINLDITGALKLPAANTSLRPSPVTGMIRFNSEDGQFEGYDGIAWSGLGGVIDVNQDTKITAENSPGLNNDELKFFANGSLTAMFDQTDAYFYGNVEVSGAVQIDGNTVIGNTSTDTVSVVANFTSDLIPSVNNTYSLGTESKNWASVNANVVNVDTIRSYDEIVKFDNTGAIKLPSANTALRPAGSAGMLRFNLEYDQFEGYNGIAWSGLGGVIDVNQDTKITAEDSPGANNDELKFFADGTLSALFNKTDAYFYGNVDVAGDVQIDGNTQINGNTQIDGTAQIDGNTLINGNTQINGNALINGNTIIGIANTDTINVVADFISNLNPATDKTYNIGSELKNWFTLNIDTIRSSDEIVKFATTGAIKLPSANTALRPTGPAGMLRFNTDENRFEGWDGNIWSGLAGSVIDLDRNTFIIAETSAGADNNELDFVTNNVQRMQIGSNGNLLFGNDLNKLIIDFATGDVFVNGKLTANTNLILDPVGYISAANNTIADVADPVNLQDAVTLNYLNNELNAGLTIVDNANTYSESINLLQNPTIELGRGLEIEEISSANNSFKFGIDLTGVSPGIYGNDGFIPRIRITEDGRIDFAAEINIELQANAIPDFTETTQDLIALMIRDGTHEGIIPVYNDPGNSMSFLAANFNINLTGDLSGSAQVTRLSNTTIDATITTDYVGDVTSPANSGIIVTHNPSVNSTADVVLDFSYLNTLYVPATGGTFTGNISAPRFVDSNNTNFYMDPNGTSRINDIEVGFGSTFSQIKMRDGSGTFSSIYGQGGRIGFLNNTFNYAAYSERSTGNWVVSSDVRAKRFVDIDALTYFVHPGGTDTYLRQITVQDKITVSSIAIGGDVGVRTIKTTTGALTLDASGGISLQGDGNDLNVNNSKIINLLNPTSGQDAATKSYVDAAAQGLRVIPAALAATTTNLNATFVSGVLTSNDNGAFVVDDVVAFVVGSRVLVKNQNNAAQNGSYVVTVVGDASTPWVLTRGEYFNESSEIPGAFQFVTDGTLNRSTGWVATVTDAETFVIGTDAVVWYQFSGAGTYTAGEALTLTGTEFSISDGDIGNNKLANPSISIAGEAGANTVIALGDTLIIEGTNGVDTTISSGKVSIAVNILDGGTF